MVEMQDLDNFPYFWTQEICAWELATYVFKYTALVGPHPR